MPFPVSLAIQLMIRRCVPETKVQVYVQLSDVCAGGCFFGWTMWSLHFPSLSETEFGPVLQKS